MWDLETKLKLSNKANREILIEWTKAECQVKDRAIYKPLEAIYPSLQKIFEKMVESTDPVQNIKDMESQLSGKSSSQMLLLKVFAKVFGRLLPEDETINGLQNVIDSYEEIKENFPGLIRTERQIYSRMLDAIKEVSKEQGKDISEIIWSPEDRDEVYRRIWPTRNQAEFYTDQDTRIVIRMFYQLSEMYASIEEIPSGRKAVKKVPFAVPNSDEIGAIEEAYRNYYRAELDRIYAPKDAPADIPSGEDQDQR